MYVDSAYWHNKVLDFKDKKHPLFVSSCGTYHLFTKPKLPTNRPRGRIDYQIIYIASGKGQFFFGGEEQIIPAGNMIIFRPKEEQRYYYYGEDHTEVYWVHFTGSNVKNILRSYGIADDIRVIHTGTSLEFKNIFLKMIQELKMEKDNYEEAALLQLKYLFILLNRLLNAKPRNKNAGLMEEMNVAVKYFHQNYNKPLSIEEYAVTHNMSVSWFIRNFKEYSGSTPAQYLLSLRISNAQTLLESTDYSVSEISEIVGYENALYFSRIFKKQNGVSPQQYRKNLTLEVNKD